MIYQFADLELDTGRRQLNRAGVPVKVTRLSYRLLEALVEASPNLLTPDELVDRVWGPRRVVSPNSLSQRVTMLRQSLGDEAQAPNYIEGVRGQGYRLIPVVTPKPEEPQRETSTSDPAADGPARQDSRRSRAGTVATLLAAIVIAGLVWLGIAIASKDRYQRQVDDSEHFRSVAVLPFVNLSPEADDSFFAAGIHEEVLNKLSKIAGLRVISRTSMLHYENTREPIPTIARELAVDSVVEGSVRFAENRIRVTIQVVDGQRDVHLWSETYDRELEDIFETESAIARDVAAALHQVVSEESSASLSSSHTLDVEAYAQFMQGRQALTQRKPGSLEAALSHFEHATELDPGFALAWVGVADTWNMLADYSALDVKTTFELRQAAIDKALAIDPSLGEAWVSLATLRADQRSVDEAEKYFLRGIELSPGYVPAHTSYGLFLANFVGRAEEALPHLRNAVELDPEGPLSPFTRGALASSLWHLGRVEEALSIERERIAVDPRDAHNIANYSAHLEDLGRLDEAMFWAREAARADPANYRVRWRECDALLALADDPALEKCRDAVLTEFPQAPVYHSMRYWKEYYIYRQQYALMQERMLELYEVNQHLSADALGLAYLYNGRPAKALALWSEFFPDLFTVGRLPDVVGGTVVAAIMLKLNGEPEQADALFVQALWAMDKRHRIRRPNFFFWDIIAHVFRDDRDRAVAALRDLIDSGWRRGWWNLRGPGFEAISEDPEWRVLFAQLQDDIKRQRDNYYAHQNDPEYWQ